MAAYSLTSPYYSTPTVNGYLDVISFREIAGQTDDIIYEIEPKYENRPDLLAYDFYGDVKLWWIFSVRNKNIIKDPVFDMVPGTSIYVPSPTYLKNTLGI
jgi:hypothetical protein